MTTEDMLRVPVCPPGLLSANAARPVGELTPQSRVTYDDGNGVFRMNGGMVRIAMSEKRIRVGCNEITVEAARKLMEMHGERFGVTQERFHEIQG
jgi:hypothetical protein